MAPICELSAQGFRPRNTSGSALNSSGQASGGVIGTAAERGQLRAVGSTVSVDTRSGGPGTEVPGRTVSVSADLLQVYNQTSTAKTEEELTAIARASAKVVGDSKRSKIDRDYASSLLAWALNRRGELRSEQAATFVADGDSERAMKIDAMACDDFATAVEYAPSNWRHRHNWAIALAMKGEYVKAIEQLSRALDLNPKYANAHFNRGELHFETGNYRAAEQDYTKAIELVEDAQYFNSRAHCRFLLNEFQSAQVDYRRAVQLQPESAVYQTDLGDALQYSGNWEESAKAYRAAVAADSSYFRAYQNAAWLMATCPDDKYRNSDLALSAARKAIELRGQRTVEGTETLAAATAAIGKHAEAVKLQEESMQLASKQQIEPQQIEESRQRLALYRAGQAYIQPEPTREESDKSRTASREAAKR